MRMLKQAPSFDLGSESPQRTEGKEPVLAGPWLAGEMEVRLRFLLPCLRAG